MAIQTSECLGIDDQKGRHVMLEIMDTAGTEQFSKWSDVKV
jgi:hypothetical protein